MTAGTGASVGDLYARYTALKFERRGKVLILTMDNPPMNAMTPQMHNELSRVFFDINRDPETAVVVITGAGEKAFSAGGDINEMARRIEASDHEPWVRGNFEAREIVYGALRLERPLIARVNGHAMGLGATLAVLSDISFMMEKARIADTHVKVGLAAGDGGSLMWPMLMGFANAKRYLLTGDDMTGRQAAELGLIGEAVSSFEELDEKVYAMADRLASGATRAINATKYCVNLLLRKMLEGGIEAHLGLETYNYLSKDHYEAVSAFRDKRTPEFKGL